MAVTDSDLVLEDGTGLTTSNVYATRTDATTYHRLLGNDLWAEADENDQCVALLRATAYVDQRWTFVSTTAEDTQALEFPRYSLYNKKGKDVSEEVPNEIFKATCEYALQVLGTGSVLIELSPTPDQDDEFVTYKREKVGTLEEETRYASSRGVRVRRSYPKADRIVRNSGYVAGGVGGAIR